MFILVAETFNYNNGKVTSHECNHEYFETRADVDSRVDWYVSDVYEKHITVCGPDFITINFYDETYEKIIKKIYLLIMEV